MEEVLQALASFFVYAVVAVFAQNAVFTRALGVSRVVKLVDDGTVDTVMFGSLLCAVQLISAPLGYFASGWISQLPYRDYIRPLVFLGCAAVAFFVVLLFSVVIFRVDGARRAVAVLPMATFNTCLLGTLLVSLCKILILHRRLALRWAAALAMCWLLWW
ncbi:MAG: NADH:ubiquinone oxidoreductase, subunit RnfA [Ruthenibacterium sp.]